MYLAGRREVLDFMRRHADAKAVLESWVADVEEAEWFSPHEVRQKFASADFLGDNIVIFNIRGNKYRLMAKVTYDPQIVRVMEIGTHNEYISWPKK